MAGKSPVNAILNLSAHFKDQPLPEGTSVVWSGEGEWNITLDVFRDLGIAFGAALILIYILVITSYSIHYTKLYESSRVLTGFFVCSRPGPWAWT